MLTTYHLKEILNKLRLISVTIVLIIASLLLLIEPSGAETYKIKMGTDDGKPEFVPNTITINPGDTLKWINNRWSPCNIVFDDTQIPEKLAEQLSHEKLLFAMGEIYAKTIPTDIPSGEYTYYCEPHRNANMIGKIIIE